MSGQVTISEHEGVRYLHLGSPWVQGAMRISAPQHLELEYVQQMMMWSLFNPAPKHIVQLGLGAGSLTRFCYDNFPESRVTTVELNPAVVRACHVLFHLPPNNERLNVTIECAEHYLAHVQPESIEVLQVDLYNAESHAPALQSAGFYEACARSLGKNGVLTVNLLGNELVHATNLHHLQSCFAAVAWLPESHDGNIVAIAFKAAPQVDFDDLYDKALEIAKNYGLPARNWVDGLYAWMEQE
ncbi:spermidine synthase [Paenalcaligenes niemegkensis]|uniref:spermidine synthase n=1 Tax=Paenalcaligenes niemegkensis TaxID=2895469 RepID=UPI001EE92D2D|nr:spermidine synthase [Paenalcaligenes niemegkensis]MCQ9615519.1 spermidine synthase [Paenalcaligenes niemegkensis]